MSGSAAAHLLAFRRAYAAALRRYAGERCEESLTVAYELGRRAVTERLSVLDLAVIHQEGVAQLLAESEQAAEARRVTGLADDFFLESLGSFEMVHRGAGATRESIDRHRRATHLARQLSTFLADSSLAAAPESLEEILLLAVDQAREIILADCCLAAVSGDAARAGARAVSHDDPWEQWTWTERLEPPVIERALQERGGSARLTGEPAAALLSAAAGGPVPALGGWAAATLTSLDGTAVGAIQGFTRRRAGFSAEDLGALTHLAQMVSGAAERMRLYQAGGL